jgi:hypothetical protein
LRNTSQELALEPYQAADQKARIGYSKHAGLFLPAGSIYRIKRINPFPPGWIFTGFYQFSVSLHQHLNFIWGQVLIDTKEQRG